MRSTSASNSSRAGFFGVVVALPRPGVDSSRSHVAPRALTYQHRVQGICGRPDMNHATPPEIDPELVAAVKLLQEKGLVAPDRTVAPLSEVRAAQERIGAFLGEGLVLLKNERDLSLPRSEE